ncbi:MAG: hypothetical protein ACYTG6_02975 [Planctomycetota bacterium]
MYPEQQRFWVSLLNLERTWTGDDDALHILPPRFRDFESTAHWPRRKALTFLLNNLEMIRESHRRLEAGEPLDYDLLNHGLASLRLRLNPWRSLADVKSAAQAKADLGSRLESLQVTGEHGDLNPGTRYIRATVERSLYYFACYVDARLADPAYPEASAGRWRVVADGGQSGDLTLVSPAGEHVLP